MRVHHIINSYSLQGGGAERLVRGLHLGLRERGVDSRLLGIERHADNELEAARTLGLKSTRSIAAIRGIKKYLESECRVGDVVHAHLFPTNFYCSLLRKHVKGGVLTTEHSTSNGRRDRWWGRMLDSQIYSKYDRIACISEGTKSSLNTWLPGCRKKTSVITNGVPISFTECYQRTEKDRSLVVSIGNLREAKNYENAIRAVASITALDFEYWIAGEGELRGALESLIARLDLGDRVKLLGRVDDVAGLLKRADVFFMPSKWEGFGMAAVEAMNAGLPLVASDVQGLKEVVAEDCAFLCDPSSIASMTIALETYLTNRDLREVHGKAAFQRSHRFAEEGMVKQYMALYAKLA